MLIGIGRVQPQMGLALLELARNDCPDAIDLRQRRVPQIKPAAAFTMLWIEAMALETGIGKNRPHIAVEFDFVRERRLRSQHRHSDEGSENVNRGELHGANCGTRGTLDKLSSVTRLRRARGGK